LLDEIQLVDHPVAFLQAGDVLPTFLFITVYLIK